MRPHLMPAASKIDARRYDVVVFPLVPVMPTRTRSALGLPKNAAESAASASLASDTCCQGTAVSAGGASADPGVSAMTAMAPRAIASRVNAAPSALRPRSATKTEPATTSRESLVTEATVAAEARSVSGVPLCTSNGARPAVAFRRSPSVTGELRQAAGGRASAHTHHRERGRCPPPATARAQNHLR